MENIHINFREDSLTIIVENGGTLELVNLPEPEIRYLQDYFSLLRMVNQEKDGVQIEHIIKAMMVHIGGMMEKEPGEE